MKKIILGLFLILGVVSFSAPNFINIKAIEKAGYRVMQDDKTAFSVSAVTAESAMTISYFFNLSNTQNVVAEFNKAVIDNAPAGAVYKGTTENDKAYINEFVLDNGDLNLYTFVGKKARKNGVYVVVHLGLKGSYLPKDKLDPLSTTALEEADSYLK